jgi:hypothetical protein
MVVEIEIEIEIGGVVAETEEEAAVEVETEIGGEVVEIEGATAETETEEDKQKEQMGYVHIDVVKLAKKSARLERYLRSAKINLESMKKMLRLDTENVSDDSSSSLSDQEPDLNALETAALQQVVVPEKLVPHFKPGKALREAVDFNLPADESVLDVAGSAAP